MNATTRPGLREAARTMSCALRLCLMEQVSGRMASFSKFLNFEAGAVLNFGVICSRTRRTRASSLSTPRRTDYIDVERCAMQCNSRHWPFICTGASRLSRISLQKQCLLDVNSSRRRSLCFPWIGSTTLFAMANSRLKMIEKLWYAWAIEQ